MLVLRNCSFIKELTEGTTLEKGDLLIKEDKISQIAPCGTVFEDVDKELDLKGATVMPGLINMHVHLFHIKNCSFAEMGHVLPCDRPFNALSYAQCLLDLGYTTIRDCGDIKYYAVSSVKKAINSGIVEGPRIINSGLFLCPTDAGNRGLEGLDILRMVDGPMEMRREARESFMYGADFVKLYASGTMMVMGSEPGVLTMEEDEIREAVKIANKFGSYCAMHCHGEEGIDVAVHCGVHTIEHASFIGDKTLKYLDGRTDVGIVPTLAIVKDLCTPSPGLDPQLAELMKQRSTQIISCLKNAYKYDILIGWGTDVSMEATKKDPAAEFQMRKEVLGFENIDILKQVTINSAKLLYKDDSIGSIKVGKLADLIVVEGNPVDDISVMYSSPAHVFKGGKMIR